MLKNNNNNNNNNSNNKITLDSMRVLVMIKDADLQLPELDQRTGRPL
jgi:hypothetical protein